MVGIEGKSKACLNCKRRRVKCGLERPQCLRCIKAHLTCAGYQRQVVFVNRSPEDPSVSAPSVLARKRPSGSNATSIQEELDVLVQLLSFPKSSSSPFRLKALSLLEKLYLPAPDLASRKTQSDNSCFSWIRGICEMEQPCQCFDQALLAFCMAQVYVTKSGSVSYADCSSRYIHAVQLLAEILDCEDDERLNYILAPMAVLTTCEFFIGSTDEGIQVHVKGIADVVRLREKKSRLLRIPADIWVKLCAQLRFVSLLSSLASLRHGHITAAQWSGLIAEQSPKDPLIELMDITSDLPGTLEAAAQTVELPQTCMLPSDSTMTITATLHTILNATLGWQDSFFAIYPDPPYTTTSAKSTNPSDVNHQGKLFPLAFEFSSPELAFYFVISWTIQLQIQYALLRLQPEIDTQDLSQHRIETHKLASNLCQSMEYCHRVKMGTLGPQLTLFPRWVLKHYFRWFGTARELAWCEAIDRMGAPGHRCGMGMMMFQDPFEGDAGYSDER